MAILTTTRRAALIALALAGLLFAGCASGGIFGGGDDSDAEPDYDRSDRITEVRGSVDHVDTRDSIIWVEPSGVYRNDLRNEDDQIALRYDDSTSVEFNGKTYEPDALEKGDRIVAKVDDTGSRLYAREVEVTYDVTSSTRDDDADTADRGDDRYDDEDVSEVRGKVRWLDEDRKMMELEDTSWGFGATSGGRRDDVIEVYYDADTVVEYQGERYSPKDLERGDEVQVELREIGSRYHADEILVVASVRD